MDTFPIHEAVKKKHLLAALLDPFLPRATSPPCHWYTSQYTSQRVSSPQLAPVDAQEKQLDSEF